MSAAGNPGALQQRSSVKKGGSGEHRTGGFHTKVTLPWRSRPGLLKTVGLGKVVAKDGVALQPQKTCPCRYGADRRVGNLGRPSPSRKGRCKVRRLAVNV